MDMNNKIDFHSLKETIVFPTPDSMASYEEAQEYAKKNGIRSMRQWFAFHNERKGGSARPRNIPGDPSKFYSRRKTWVSWPDFLGTDTKATQIKKEEFLSLEDCKSWFASNKIYTVTQFRELSKSGNRPEKIPSAPDKKYNEKFSEILCPKESAYLDFDEAKALVRTFKFSSYLEFRKGRRENLDRLACIPCNPDKFYEKEEKWTSWPDFLGYSRLRNEN